MVSIDELEKVLRDCWSRDTVYPKDVDRWTPELPEIGQCFVTSMVVNDYFGGLICYNKKFNHYFNELPDGTIVDLTRKQFNTNEEILIDVKMSRDVVERIVSVEALERYNRLLECVNNKLHKS